VIPFIVTENKMAGTVATHAGRHRNQEQWLTLLCGSKQAVPAVLAAMMATVGR